MGIMVGIAVCVGNKRAVATAPSEVEPTGIMTFADPAMQALCAKTWGDGTNITYEQAREVTEIPKNWAKDNKVITSFNELKHFKNLLYIRDAAFYGCTALTDINLELPQCASIGASAFYKCNALQNVNLDLPQLTSIGASAFLDSAVGGEMSCPNLETLSNHAMMKSKITKVLSLGKITKIPNHSWESIQTGPYGVFARCTTLTEVTLPQTLTSIGTYAFRECTALDSINLDLPALTTIGAYAFNNCKLSNVTVLDLPALTTIGGNAFSGCTMPHLRITAPQLTTIEDSYVFSGCKFAWIYIDAPLLETIGSGAFYQQKTMTRMALTAATPPTLGTGVFQYTDKLTAIYVPDESVEAYKAATNWVAYANKILPLSQYNG